MTKRLKNIIALIAAIAFLVGGAVFYVYDQKPFHTGDITGYSEIVSILWREVPSFTVREDGTFKIMQITDTHLYNSKGAKNENTIAQIKAAAEREKPDLVVATGDIFDGFNPYIFVSKLDAINSIAGMFEEINQPWAYVPGNNEGDYQGNELDVVAALASYENCIMSNIEWKDGVRLTGATQYVIELKDTDGKNVHSLVFMDSLSRLNGGYNFIKTDQIEWFTTVAQAAKEKNPQAKLSLFFHMNTPLFNEAAENGEAYKEDYAKLEAQNEKYLPANEAFDSAILAAGNVGLAAIGHLHPKENWCSYYNDIYFHIARPSGYEGSKNPGVTMITIDSKAANTRLMYTFEEILFN